MIGFLFGGGNGEVTCACDAAGDGVTNPTPINGNTVNSYNADDDGGFFHNRAAAYYTAGAMSLPGRLVAAAPRPAGLPRHAIRRRSYRQAPTLPSASAAPASVNPGGTTTLTAAVTSGSAVTRPGGR